MKELKIKTDTKVEFVFNEYPAPVRDKMLFLRHLVIETAKATDGIEELEETLKWGEPSYLTKIGSTLRMDWKPKTPDQYAMYFKCTSRLVETFRVRFEHTFEFEGNRAIVFHLDDEIPTESLKHCIKATLIYHKVKHLPTLARIIHGMELKLNFTPCRADFIKTTPWLPVGAVVICPRE